MKRSLLFSSLLCLIIGLLCGLIAPALLWQKPAMTLSPIGCSSFDTAGGPDDRALYASPLAPLDPADNAQLLSACYRVLTALKSHDPTALASEVHPDKGLTFTPYSTVEPELNMNFSSVQVKELFSDKNVYTWGHVDGRGDLIEMTIPEYLNRYGYDADYLKAPKIGIDTVVINGNALENVSNVYPGCRFVDFCYPSVDPASAGTDWRSLKLVFEPGDSRWLLVGLIHSEWTT